MEVDYGRVVEQTPWSKSYSLWAFTSVMFRSLHTRRHTHFTLTLQRGIALHHESYGIATSYREQMGNVIYLAIQTLITLPRNSPGVRKVRVEQTVNSATTFFVLSISSNQGDGRLPSSLLTLVLNQRHLRFRQLNSGFRFDS